MATHSSILAGRIPWTEEPGRLQSIGLQRVAYNWSDLARTHAHHVKMWNIFILNGTCTHTHTHNENEIFIKSVLNASYATPIYSVPFGSLSPHAILIPLFKITHKNDLTSFQWVITYNLKKTSQLCNGILSYMVRGFYSSLARQKHTVKYILGESLRKASWKRTVQNLLV